MLNVVVFASSALVLTAPVELPAGVDLLVVPTHVSTSSSAHLDPQLRQLALLAGDRFVQLATAELDARVVTLDAINAALAREQRKDLLGCDDVACYAELAGAAGTRWILASQLARDSERIRLALTLYDADAVNTVASRERVLFADSDVVRLACRELFADLFAIEAPPVHSAPAPNSPYGATSEIRPGESVASYAARNRKAQRRSGLPEELWLGENWSAGRWSRFEASGLSRPAFIERENRESTGLFIAELVTGALFIGGWAVAVTLPRDNDFKMPLFFVGSGAMFGFMGTMLADGIGNFNDMAYLGTDAAEP